MLAPLLMVGLAPNVTAGLEVNRGVPLPIMIIWATVVLLLMMAARVGLADKAAEPAPPRRREAEVALWCAVAGLLLLAMVSLLPAPPFIYQVEFGDYLAAFIRGVLRFVGLAGVAMAVRRARRRGHRRV